MNRIFADGMTNVTLSNNTLRVTLIQNGPDNTKIDAGMLIIPVNQAANFVNTMGKALKQLEEQLKDQKKEVVQ